MPLGTITSSISVEIAGAPIDVNPDLIGRLVSVEVESSMYMPSQIKVVFRDASTTTLEEGGMQLAVPIMAQAKVGMTPTQIFMGEITTVEVEYAPEGNLTIVRGFDRSHRLMHGTKAAFFEEMTASDIVEMLVAPTGLIPAVMPTSTIYKYISQANISAWAMIQQLAALENCVAYADAMGKFNFGPMPKPEESLPPVMSYEQPAESGQLVVGDNLVRVRARVTAAEQVPAVTVFGWNPDEQAPVVGLGPAIPSTAMSIDPAALPPAIAGEFGAMPYFESSRPFDDEGAAETRAMSIAADIAGSMAEVEGQCLPNPSVLAGAAISIGMAGPPFDGQYIVTSARHVYEPANGGYSTWFTVGGRQDRSLLGLASGGAARQDIRPTVPGLATGTVMNNMDPMEQGRVQVLFPWLGAYTSAWARTMQIGAGKLGGYGCLFVPEVGDEVLVGFDRGDIDYPYVIGNLYSGMVKPEPAPQIQGGVASRRIMSRMRHMIQFDDGPEALGITIQTGDTACSIKMDAEQSAITITSIGNLTINVAEQVKIQAGTGLDIQCGGSVSVQGAQGISLESAAQVAAKGAGGVTIEGSTVGVTSPSISLGA